MSAVALGGKDDALDVGAAELFFNQAFGEQVGVERGLVLLRHDLEHVPHFALVARVEQREVHLGAALALEVDRQQVGAAGEQHPDQLAAIPGVAHLAGDHREDAARRARVSARFAIAERRVGLVDDDDHRPHGPQHGEKLLEVALGLADVLRAEVAQLDAGNADRAGEAFGEVGLAGADGPADQVAHGRGVEPALGQQGRVVDQALLDAVVADEIIQGMRRLDELDQAARLPLDQALLERLEAARVKLDSGSLGAGEQALEADQAQAAGQVGKLSGGEVGQVAEPAILAVEPGGIRLRAAESGIGTSSVATCGLPTSRSLSSESWSHSRQMAMLFRLM